MSYSGSWQDISTAPKNGANILSFAPDLGIAIAMWWADETHDDGGTWRDDGAVPTHWMPLPEHPTA